MTKKGITIIEVIAVILIIGIIAAATSGLFAAFVKFFTTLPSTDLGIIGVSSQDALSVLLDGDANMPGLRFAQEILAVGAFSRQPDAGPAQYITYKISGPIESSKKSITIVWSGYYGKICRYVGDFIGSVRESFEKGSSTQIIPQPFQQMNYILQREVAIPGGTHGECFVIIQPPSPPSPPQTVIPVFSYYKADNSVWQGGEAPSLIKRIDFNIKLVHVSQAHHERSSERDFIPYDQLKGEEQTSSELTSGAAIPDYK